MPLNSNLDHISSCRYNNPIALKVCKTPFLSNSLNNHLFFLHLSFGPIDLDSAGSVFLLCLFISSSFYWSCFIPELDFRAACKVDFLFYVRRFSLHLNFFCRIKVKSAPHLSTTVNFGMELYLPLLRCLSWFIESSRGWWTTLLSHPFCTH